MLAASAILTVAAVTVAQAQEADARAKSLSAPGLLAAVRTAYEHNRAVLSSSGTIHFSSCDGKLDPAPTLEGVRASLRAPWTRRSPSQGLYVFDGAYRRYENVYSAEQITSRRNRLSPTQWQSQISSDRLLTDGESTLVNRINVSEDEKTIRHTAGLRAGAQEFFRIGDGIPLQIGNPDASDYDLGKLLAKAQEGRDKAFVAEVDEAAVLDGVPVIKIRAELPSHANKLQITYWVDLEHGAIPLQTLVLANIEHRKIHVFLQFNSDDIKWVGKGWLPFRFSAAQGDISSTGDVPSIFVREYVINDADFDKRPERSMFALEFPEERPLSDADRMLSLGKRRVWGVDDFSQQARNRATRIKLSAPGSAPEMPEAANPWSWWPGVAVLIGIASLVTAGGLRFWKGRRRA
jgi:hypothetical protein